ncbi:MAG: hypothetical protein GX914_05950 [Erysipelotrichia bacterium]|nr:hypothetical protein [Erysipelotrichia bacterium]
MKNFFKLFLIILLLVVGLSGCDKGLKNKKLNQQQLWEYLSKYPRYLSEKGATDDCALVFTEGDDLVFDYSFYKGEEYNRYFTELISFTNERDYLYKLEYENPYPEEFDNAIFYIDLNPKEDNIFKFGRHLNQGSLEYVNFFADIGLTFEELLSKLNEHKTWLEVSSDLYGYYFLEIHDENQLSLGVMNSGFGLNGTISNIEYNGYMSYTVTVDYPGYEGDEITDPYDAYTTDYYMYYNPHYEILKMKLYDELIEFAPDKGLNLEEFLKALADYNSWIEENTGKDYYLGAESSGRFYLGNIKKDILYDGTLSNVEYNGYKSYTITVDYPKEGNKAAYAVEYSMYFGPKTEILMVEIEGSAVEFVPDKGLAIDELIAQLSRFEYWIKKSNEGVIYSINFSKDSIFNLYYKNSPTVHSGTIKNIEYHGLYKYTLEIEFPSTTEDKSDTLIDYYPLVYVPNSEDLIVELYQENESFIPDMVLTLEDLFNYVSKHGMWKSTKGEVGYFVRMYGDKKFHIGYLNAGGTAVGVLTKLTYNRFGSYTLEVYYPAGYFYDPELDSYDASTENYNVYCNPKKNYLVIEYAGKLVQFYQY